MPCFSCRFFLDSRGRNGERLAGGRGYCKLWDQEYYRGHECRDFSPTWIGPSQKGDTLKEPSGCFISSACAEYLGLPDDCRELNILRSFRDNILKSTSEGTALVEEYYKIAPPLVNKINESANKKIIYQNIYEYILLCIENIEKKDYKKAVKQYKKMVEYVSEEV